MKNFPEPIANESPASQKARVMKALPMLNMLIGKAFATNCSAETDWDQIRKATAEAVTGQPAHLLVSNIHLLNSNSLPDIWDGKPFQ